MKNINAQQSFKNFVTAAIICFGLFNSVSCFAQSSFKNENKASSFQYMKKLNSVFDFVEQNYVDEIDPRILYEGALKGMLDAIGDPYTLYLDPNYMRDLSDTTSGSFGGVGLSISKPTENKPNKPAYVEVESPIEDSPGAKAGIHSGDFIIAIEGEPTPEMSMNEVLDKLRGEIGTAVTITILRGANMKFDVKLIRDKIKRLKKRIGKMEKNIRKDKDESLYGLEKYDEELTGLEHELDDVIKSKKQALSEFENTAKKDITDEIKARYAEELNRMKQENDAAYKAQADAESQIKTLSIDISSKYETYIGKENLSVPALDSLLEIMENGNARNIGEAIAYYKQNLTGTV